jgi:hypothetical protein
MLDASTLEDRTRPVVEPTGWLSNRLRRLHSSMGVRHIDHAPMSTLKPWGLYPGDQRFIASH